MFSISKLACCLLLTAFLCTGCIGIDHKERGKNYCAGDSLQYVLCMRSRMGFTFRLNPGECIRVDYSCEVIPVFTRNAEYSGYPK